MYSHVLLLCIAMYSHAYYVLPCITMYLARYRFSSSFSSCAQCSANSSCLDRISAGAAFALLSASDSFCSTWTLCFSFAIFARHTVCIFLVWIFTTCTRPAVRSARFNTAWSNKFSDGFILAIVAATFPWTSLTLLVVWASHSSTSNFGRIFNILATGTTCAEKVTL